MTGGQMAPTTLPGQKAQTAPLGRDPKETGYPIVISEMLSTLRGATYIERTSIHNVPNIKKTKKAIKKAIECQMAGKGFSMVEILSTCPTNWGLNAPQSMEWLKDNMLEYFPLGVYKDTTEEADQ
jgi:2-oxoglutarate ferredoxin oxidoreductase subunit beta